MIVDQDLLAEVLEHVISPFDQLVCLDHGTKIQIPRLVHHHVRSLGLHPGAFNGGHNPLLIYGALRIFILQPARAELLVPFARSPHGDLRILEADVVPPAGSTRRLGEKEVVRPGCQESEENDIEDKSESPAHCLVKDNIPASAFHVNVVFGRISPCGPEQRKVIWSNVLDAHDQHSRNGDIHYHRHRKYLCLEAPWVLVEVRYVDVLWVETCEKGLKVLGWERIWGRWSGRFELRGRDCRPSLGLTLDYFARHLDGEVQDASK